jgi:hypothetical protein
VAKTPVHQITMSRSELARAKAAGSRSGPLAKGPLTDEQIAARHAKEMEQVRRIASGEGGKARREMKNIEHRAQRKLYQELIPAAETRYPELAHLLRAVYTIPVYNANSADPDQRTRNKINAARMKAEGQKAGSPDNHVPVPRAIGAFRYGSLFLELKAETYPNDAQRDRFPQLAACGNAVVTLRSKDEHTLAANALDIIVFYLQGRPDFYVMGHPRFTYVHNSTLSLAEISP